MKFLLDTPYAIALVDRNSMGMNEPGVLDKAEEAGDISISIASLWEIAIKSRLGKLPLNLPVEQWPDMLAVLDVPLLPIIHPHVLSNIGPAIATRDPFDRLLLGVCAAEGMMLVTADEALLKHPLAWRPFPL